MTVLFRLEWVWRQKDGSGVTLQWRPLFEFGFYYISREEPSNVSEQATNMIKCSVKNSSDPSRRDLGGEEWESGKSWFRSKVQISGVR